MTTFIPLYDDLRAVLARIPKRSPTILTNTRARPWTTQRLRDRVPTQDIRRYVARTAATKAAIQQLNEAKRR